MAYPSVVTLRPGIRRLGRINASQAIRTERSGYNLRATVQEKAAQPSSLKSQPSLERNGPVEKTVAVTGKHESNHLTRAGAGSAHQTQRCRCCRRGLMPRAADAYPPGAKSVERRNSNPPCKFICNFPGRPLERYFPNRLLLGPQVPSSACPH